MLSDINLKLAGALADHEELTERKEDIFAALTRYFGTAPTIIGAEVFQCQKMVSEEAPWGQHGAGRTLFPPREKMVIDHIKVEVERNFAALIKPDAGNLPSDKSTVRVYLSDKKPTLRGRIGTRLLNIFRPSRITAYRTTD